MAEILLERLTPIEKALIYRRRTSKTYKEIGRDVGLHRNTVMRKVEVVPDCGTEELSDLEKALIKRKRLGMTQLECALCMGVSRYWFNQMETGKAPYEALLKFWEL